MENIDLLKEVAPSESELKDIIINFVGEKLSPQSDLVTVGNIIDVFAEQFPEFLLAVAEENWINGYTQALNDLEYCKKSQTTEEDNEKLSN